jgi:hypothetical protein
MEINIETPETDGKQKVGAAAAASMSKLAATRSTENSHLDAVCCRLSDHNHDDVTCERCGCELQPKWTRPANGPDRPLCLSFFDE